MENQFGFNADIVSQMAQTEGNFLLCLSCLQTFHETCFIFFSESLSDKKDIFYYASYKQWKKVHGKLKNRHIFVSNINIIPCG